MDGISMPNTDAMPFIDHLAAQIADIQATHDFAAFSSFIRRRETQAYLRAFLPLVQEDFTRAREELDRRQMDLLPERLDDLLGKTNGKLTLIIDFLRARLEKKSARALATSIMKSYEATTQKDGALAATGATVTPVSSTPDHTITNDWHLALPIPPAYEELKKTSPSALNAYRTCPFTFYLKKALPGRAFKSLTALEPFEYGNLAHEALEAFGCDLALRESEDARELGDFLARRVDASLLARFGAHVPERVRAQGEDLKRRLADFAERQAARHAEGWRIVAVETKLEIAYPIEAPDGTTHRVLIAGKSDRIDYNAARDQWCIIDYKTWDKADEKRMDDFQLPLYCAMLDASEDEPFKAATREKILATFCVIGATRDEVLFLDARANGLFRGDALPTKEAEIKETIQRIERGIFWPFNAAARSWRFDFEKWIGEHPDETLSRAWIKDQMARVDAVNVVGTDGARGANGAHDEVPAKIALQAFLDLVELADHPNDALAYRHFSLTPLARAKYGLSVPARARLAQEMAEAFMTRGLKKTLCDLRSLLDPNPEKAWNHTTETLFVDMIAKAEAFERARTSRTLLSDFAPFSNDSEAAVTFPFPPRAGAPGASRADSRGT